MSPEFEQCQDYFDSYAEMGSVIILLVVFLPGSLKHDLYVLFYWLIWLPYKLIIGQINLDIEYN